MVMKFDEAFIETLSTAPNGAQFRVGVPVEHDLVELRKALVDASGRAVVISVRLGPLEVAATPTGVVFTCAIDAVDEKVSAGEYTLPTAMSARQYVYVGRLIERMKFDA
jgi:hypothetical protein